MSGIETSVSIGYKDADSLAGSTFSIEQSSRAAEPGQAWFRVHPSSTGILLRATSGNITLSTGGRGLDKRVDQFLYFSGSKTVQVNYFPKFPPIMELVGRFVTEEGEFVYPTFSYDATRRQIVSSISGYGTLRVRYDAPYDLWRATFSEVTGGSPFGRDPNAPAVEMYSGSTVFFSSGSGSPDEDDDPSLLTGGFYPLTVVGIKGDEVQTASLSPTPKLDETLSNYYGMSNSGARLDELKLEIDPDYPPRLSSNNANDLSASCRVRLYPNVTGVSLSLTSGTITETASIDGTAVRESVSFNGSPSSQLGYQPQLKPSFEVLTGKFIDKWGRSFTPTIVGPGERVRVVEWINSNTYKNPVTRTTGSDEVVITDMFGNTVPCYGVILASYPVSYKQYQIDFQYDQEKRRFKSIYVVAAKGVQTATLQIQPPTLRGLY